MDIQWWATGVALALEGSISFQKKMIERETLFLAISVKLRFKLSRLSSSLPYIPLDLVLSVTENQRLVKTAPWKRKTMDPNPGDARHTTEN